MSKEKELEIQMQFLDEAADYLNTLEVVLLEVKANSRIELQKINAALRAAHSLKGGAAMMGFQILSDLAHRLEDAFKVLKTKKKSLEVDNELQSLLLSGVDWLRQIVELLAVKNVIDQEWITTFCYPVFTQLHERLGEPALEDANTVFSDESEPEQIISLLFQTEVESSLQRLESMLADGEHLGLGEEVGNMAAELGGLGEMFQLEAFTKLCESITQHLASSPTQAAQIADLALQAWRRSQALILTKQIEHLPTEIILPDVNVESAIELEIEDIQETSQDKITAETLALLDANIADISPAVDSLQLKTYQNIDDNFVQPLAAEVITSNHKLETPESTVRVPVKQLEQINDFFAELTLQRNSLNLQLERLNKLIRNLVGRVKTLEEENYQLRIGYDRMTTHSIVASALSLPVGVVAKKEENESVKSYKNKGISPHGFDALEMDRYNELHLLSQAVMETIVQIQEITNDIELSVEDADQVTRILNKTTKHLQTKLTQVRMRPLSDIVDRFPRALRDLCVEYGKNVQFQIEGGNTLIERSILEALNDPLMHLLRNAFDHGIENPVTRKRQGKAEQGLIKITGTHQGNRTLITISDDGRGISLEDIRTRALAMGLDAFLLDQADEEELLSLIFEPGFSTSTEVTSLSGRGVGMDVVRNNLKLVHGDIKVDTRQGVGTTFTLSVPFTLSVIRVLLVESNQMLLAFPTDVISEIFLLQNLRVLLIAGNEVINWENSMVPLINLGNYLHFNCPYRKTSMLESPPTINATSVLIIQGGNQLAALQVDRCWGEQEVAIRRVEGNISMAAGFSNCTILGDGRVVPLVNANELLYGIASCQIAPHRNQLASAQLNTSLLPPTHVKSANDKGTILIVDDSINVRRFLALTLEKVGYQVEQAKDGQEAVDKLLGGLQVQAVISDIEMPRLDGFGLLVQIQSHDHLKHIPITILSSRGGDKHRELAMQLGAIAYFTKPYNEQELLQTLEQIIFASMEVSL